MPESSPVFDQSDSSYIFDFSCPYATAATEEVKTTFLTLFLEHASKTLKVPSTAGLIRTSSSLGTSNIKGEATCKTYSQPFTASSQPLSSSKSQI